MINSKKPYRSVTLFTISPPVSVPGTRLLNLPKKLAHSDPTFNKQCRQCFLPPTQIKNARSVCPDVNCPRKKATDALVFYFKHTARSLILTQIPFGESNFTLGDFTQQGITASESTLRQAAATCLDYLSTRATRAIISSYEQGQIVRSLAIVLLGALMVVVQKSPDPQLNFLLTT